MHWREFIIRVTNWQALCHCPEEWEDEVGKWDRGSGNGENRQRSNILERKKLAAIFFVLYRVFCCILCVLTLSWFNYLFHICVLFDSIVLDIYIFLALRKWFLKTDIKHNVLNIHIPITQKLTLKHWFYLNLFKINIK